MWLICDSHTDPTSCSYAIRICLFHAPYVTRIWLKHAAVSDTTQTWLRYESDMTAWVVSLRHGSKQSLDLLRLWIDPLGSCLVYVHTFFVKVILKYVLGRHTLRELMCPMEPCKSFCTTLQLLLSGSKQFRHTQAVIELCVVNVTDADQHWMVNIQFCLCVW